MACLVKRPNGSYEIRFQDHQRNPRSVYISEKNTKGKIVESKSRRMAETVASHLEHIASRRRHNQTPSPEVDAWLAAIDGKLHARLAGFGLVDPRAADVPATDKKLLGPWVAEFIAKRKSLKESTRKSLDMAGRNLTHYFGDDRELSSITPGDASDYREWLLSEGNLRTKKDDKSLADNTVRRRIGRARQIFTAAIRHQLIENNPFDGLPATVNANEERQVFVSHDWIERCIKAAPCESWRIIIALARYGGMRRHETLLQRWEDVDIPKRRMVIRSEKTGIRVCPIFSELLPHIMRAKEMAESGADTLQTRYTDATNIGTTFSKIITRAGLVPWEKLFQNLRASRETELMALYPVKDVSSWLGNSAPIAMKHYAMPLQDSFERAIKDGAGGVSPKLHRILHQSTASSGDHRQSCQDGEKQENEKTPVKTEVSSLLSAAANNLNSRSGTRTRTPLTGKGF